MKRLSKDDRWRHMRHLRAVARLVKKRRLKRNCLKVIAAKFVTLEAPEVFSLMENGPRRRLLRFLRRMREAIVCGGKSVRIDFGLTRRLVADGMLLFVAELRRAIRLAQPGSRVHCLPARNNKVEQVLQQLGIYALLHHRRRIKPRDADVVDWRYACGNDVRGEKYDDILGPYDGLLAPGVTTGFYNGISEAMTNCHHHAYIAQRKDGLPVHDRERTWWMFSQAKDEALFVAFCDLGIGIPETLPVTKPDLWNRILDALPGRRVRDAHAIREAILESRTRTGLSHRGRGLQQMIEAIERAQRGHLVIMSNRGCYTHRDGREFTSNFEDSIMGTLIAWRVPIARRTGQD